MRLGIKDTRVIEAFIHRRPSAGHKLSTDGHRLDGHWMGGNGIAEWDDGSIAFHDLGSRAAQSVQRAVKKRAKHLHQNPTFWIQKALGTKRRRVGKGPHHRKAVRVVSAHKGALHRQLGVPVGEKIPVKKLRAAAKKGGTLGRRARLALTLRKLGKRKR